MSLLAKIQIKTDGPMGTIILNGVDVSSQIFGFELVGNAGHIPVVKLAFAADLEFEGDVNVVPAETAVSNDTPKEPTPEQCKSNDVVYETEYKVGYAIWYPQMGGYIGRAVAVMDKNWTEYPGGGRSGGCVDVYVWHDGEFPFSEDGRDPYLVHHCSPEQFVTFGELLESLNDLGKVSTE